MAVSTWPIDTRELDWALIRVAGFVDELAVRADAQASPAGSTDEDVTVHCDDVLIDGQQPPRRVVVGPVDLDLDGHRVVVGGTSPTAISTPSSRTGQPVLLGEQDLVAVVGELQLGVVVELFDHLGLHVGVDLVVAHGHHEHERQGVGLGRRRLVDDDLADGRDVDAGGRVTCRRRLGPPHAAPTVTAARATTARVLTARTSTWTARSPAGRRARRRGAGAQVDDPLDGAVGPAVGQVGRQVGQVDDRLAPLAEVDQAELVARRLDDAVGRLQAVDLPLQVGVDLLQLAELGLEPAHLVVLVEPRAHRQAEQGGADGAGDRRGRRA